MVFRHARAWLGRRAIFTGLMATIGSLCFLAFSTFTASASSAPPCTMVGKGAFTSGGNQILKEDSLSTDLTQPQRLTMRSLSGPHMFFRLTSLTSASCRDNTSYPAEETGVPVNYFNGNGTGSFGSSAQSTTPGYSVRVEVGDRGDSASADNTTADVFSFTVTDSHGNVVWQGRGNLTSGSEEISEAGPPPVGSCAPSSSLAVAVVKGTNVVAYVPKGWWGSGATGISAVNVEGSALTPTAIGTPNAVNSAASNSVTGETVATSNGTDVYLIKGTSLTNTLTDGGSGNLDFSGGSPTTSGVAVDGTRNLAVLGLSVAGSPGFQFLNLANNTFGTPFTSPSGEISEDPLIDPFRNLLLSASENSNYEIVDISNPASPKFYEHATGGGELDSSGEDCSTGIILAPAEFSGPSSVFIADISHATFTPGSPSGTWTAPSQNQTLSESNLSAGASGIAVAQGTHTGVITGEFGGNQITAFRLPATSGSGVPAITDWVSCGIGNTPDSSSWDEGYDPHTVTAYQSPNSSDAIGLFANGGANWLAKVDLTNLLNPTVVPRDGAGHACASGTIPSSVESFISVP